MMGVLFDDLNIDNGDENHGRKLLKWAPQKEPGPDAGPLPNGHLVIELSLFNVRVGSRKTC